MAERATLEAAIEMRGCLWRSEQNPDEFLVIRSSNDAFIVFNLKVPLSIAARLPLKRPLSHQFINGSSPDLVMMAPEALKVHSRVIQPRIEPVPKKEEVKTCS